MTRKVVPIRLDDPRHVGHLECPCTGCQRLVSRPVVFLRSTRDDWFPVKHRWLRQVQRDWGKCALLAEIDGDPVAHVLFAPPIHAPGATGLPSAPVSPDAVLVLHVWVDPEHRGQGLGKLLVQSVAKDVMTRRAAAALEMFAETGVRPSGEHVPEAFCAAIGFGVEHAHPVTPRMRMDLRSTRTWLGELEQAMGWLAGAVRPKNEPATGHPAAGRVVLPSAPKTPGMQKSVNPELSRGSRPTP